MKTWIFLLTFVADLGSCLPLAAAVPMQLEAVAGEVVLRFDLSAGVTVQGQQSTDLLTWADVGELITGTDQAEELRVSRLTTGALFFRLLEVQAGLAPTPGEFAQKVIGTTFTGYTITSGTEFSWFGETGLWEYNKTGPDEGLLVFTYDEDFNDPSVYREEIVLSFSAPTAGTWRYSEYNFNVEDGTSVATGTFSL